MRRGLDERHNARSGSSYSKVLNEIGIDGFASSINIRTTRVDVDGEVLYRIKQKVFCSFCGLVGNDGSVALPARDVTVEYAIEVDAEDGLVGFSHWQFDHVVSFLPSAILSLYAEGVCCLSVFAFALTLYLCFP